MPYKFFQIPINAIADAEKSLNQFLGSHQVVNIEREWVADGSSSFWAICIDYLSKSEPSPSGRKPQVDYREVLNDGDFELFSALRRLRDEIAEEEDVRRYVIFRNDQLAEMATQRILNKDAFAAIPGVGKGRVEKYGERFLAILKGAKP
jgi:superfamily II DNA helicase RecQ